MAIVDTTTLMPAPFEDGLDVWSSGNGTPGAPTYDGAANAAFVPADQDFGGCLELLKTESTQKLRYMAQTPLVPGCYLKISARVKAVAGNLPSVRIAGWAGASGGGNVNGVVQVASSTTLNTYGDIVTVEAIVGAGARTNVELVWGTQAVFGHFGIDLTGPNGGVVRVDDLQIEDVTASFVRDLLDVVDVKDFGAIGDGSADDADAFDAADAAANGRAILVSDGVFRLGRSVTLDNPVRFVGTVTMADSSIFALTKSYDLPTYIDAFGDEVLAFKKAWQALLNFVDHESLDLGGRRIDIDGPIDMQAAVGNKDYWAIRRVIRNGQFNVKASSNWDSDTVTSLATYSTNDKFRLTNVSNVGSIQVGSLVTGSGVGREVYVKSVNVGAGTVELSLPLYDAAGTSQFTFTRFKYVLDFSNFAHMAKLELTDLEFQLDGKASGIMLAPEGLTFHLRNSSVTKPKDRGITSIGRGCQGMMFDGLNCVSKEQEASVQDRETILFNANANDVKIRDSRFVKFLHTGVLFGSGHLFTGNHWFQGDDNANGTRTAGFVLTEPNVKSFFTGNYVDNAYIEWTNEHDTNPEHSAELSFGALTITGNQFTSLNSGSWFRFIVIKPVGSGHYIQGLNVSGNVFKAINGNIDRIEIVDTSFADLDKGRFRNITFEGNSFHGINQITQNPCTLYHTQGSAAGVWTVDFGGFLPFGGWCRTVESVVNHNTFRNSSNVKVYPANYINTQQGTDRDQIKVNWEVACTGAIWARGRADNPI